MSSGPHAAEDAGTPTHDTKRIPARTWTCGTQAFDLSAPLVMGILNVTPDSFSDGGLYNSVDAALDHARRMRDEGAAIIDVGGESTRPGSAPVDEEEELARVLPVVEALLAEGFVVSVDTRHAPVATACVQAGIHIINDVSGFRDTEMQKVAAASDCGLVLMHMLGEPKTMQDEPRYDDVVGEVGAFLLEHAHELEARGVAAERICLDPGIGFGKTAAHNRILLESQERLASLGYPLMVAVSRKSYIGACTGIEEVTQRDEASALCAAAACEDGARIVRAHDVARTVTALRDSRRVLVALGSNIEPRLERLDAACEA
ncbi:MAG: dihydropteroate synthase, partial [Coriobacteriaceae bacterium]|nr:dihydropteroate synthase [Coriobacteriaceae bacterium]